MSFLDTYFDPALEIDASVSEEELTAEEIERLEAMLAVAVVAASIPRRLSDATRDELAVDKKRGRRVAHVMRQCLSGWGGEERPPTEEERRTGAQIDWESWWDKHQGELARRRIYLATWAKKTGTLRWGKSAVVRIGQECDWLDYALRD